MRRARRRGSPRSRTAPGEPAHARSSDSPSTVRRVLPFDPIAEAHRQWSGRWPEQADQMAAVTSVMRVQQLLLGEIERVLRPHGLSFASYEALRLLAFTRSGELPMGKLGERLMVHPASVTNTIDRLEQRGLVRRRAS